MTDMRLDLNERTEKEATIIFSDLADTFGISNKQIVDWAGKMTFNDIKGSALPFLMRESDLVSCALLGKKIWDVRYKSSFSDGCEFCMLAESKDSKSDSEDDYPLIEQTEENKILIALICNKALQSMFPPVGDGIGFHLDNSIALRSKESAIIGIPARGSLVRENLIANLPSVAKYLSIELKKKAPEIDRTSSYGIGGGYGA